MSFLSVTGNANFHMTQTSLTLLGFTQPTSALPIISNAQNNSKGFTSRILWYFPEPIYSRLKDLKLTPEERVFYSFYLVGVQDTKLLAGGREKQYVPEFLIEVCPPMFVFYTFSTHLITLTQTSASYQHVSSLPFSIFLKNV